MDILIYAVLAAIILGWAEAASHGQLSAFLMAFGQGCTSLGCAMMVLGVGLIFLLGVCGVFIL